MKRRQCFQCAGVVLAGVGLAGCSGTGQSDDESQSGTSNSNEDETGAATDTDSADSEDSETDSSNGNENQTEGDESDSDEEDQTNDTESDTDGESESREDNLELLTHELAVQETDEMWDDGRIIGEVQNVGDEEIALVELTVTLYDDGEELGTTLPVLGEGIEPDEIWEFEVEIIEVDPSVITDYEIDLEILVDDF